MLVLIAWVILAGRLRQIFAVAPLHAAQKRGQMRCSLDIHQDKAEANTKNHGLGRLQMVFFRLFDVMRDFFGRGLLIATISACIVVGLAPSAGASKPPDVFASLVAYRTLEGWVRAWEEPEEAQAIDPAGTGGASVTLRLSGRVIGRGSSFAGDDTAELGTMIWRATREAMEQASERSPIERDATRDEQLKQQAPRVTIDLEVANELVPLPIATLPVVLSELSPGYHGVAARVGKRVSGVFPGVYLAANRTPAQALAASLAELDLPAVTVGDPRLSLSQLRMDSGVVLYSFTTQRIAQPAAELAPVFLYRGSRLVTLDEVKPSSLHNAAMRIARHIESHHLGRDAAHGLYGTYKPWLNSPEGVAGPFEQALAAFALARYAISLAADNAVREPVYVLARSIAHDLSIIDAQETSPASSPRAAAAFIVAHAELLNDPNMKEQGLGQPVAALAAQCKAVVAEHAQRALEANEALNDPALAFVAYALSRDTIDGVESQELARRLVRRLFRDTPAAALPAMTPWLGWAELELLEENAASIPSGAGLRELRQLVWDHQLGNADVGEDGLDLVGGIVFTRGRIRLPDWQTIRPVALLATMLADDRLTSPAETPAEVARLSASLRFVLQLMVPREAGFLFLDERRAIGGVALSSWDQRLTLEASAMGLLTLTEAIEAFDSAGERLRRERPVEEQ